MSPRICSHCLCIVTALVQSGKRWRRRGCLRRWVQCFHTASSVSSTPSPLSGINKREAEGCHSIQHMANSFVVETVICDQWAPPQTPTIIKARRLQSPLRSSVASYCSPDLPVANVFSHVRLRTSSPGQTAPLIFRCNTKLSRFFGRISFISL